MSYTFRLSPVAGDRIRRLDREIASRVLRRLAWFSENFEKMKPEALTGLYTGLFKFKIGDYRVIYSINHEKKTLNVVLFNHRKDAYH
ncbi:MAG: type II toxin-antitoxin system RelE/ParE family toxin [Chloroflexi bacterium]|nr:type II toxin-antitoxin system RelE/ParE family toxin [Chloroflexota bacterium]